jgi:hypothetical protein
LSLCFEAIVLHSVMCFTLCLQALSNWLCSSLKTTQTSLQLCALFLKCSTQTVSHYPFSLEDLCGLLDVWSRCSVLSNSCMLHFWACAHCSWKLVDDVSIESLLRRGLWSILVAWVASSFECCLYSRLFWLAHTSVFACMLLWLTLLVHSAVYADGSICLDILQNQWSPIYDVAAILTSIQVVIPITSAFSKHRIVVVSGAHRF